jgi:hypothetical protein
MEMNKMAATFMDDERREEGNCKYYHLPERKGEVDRTSYKSR